ncbi:MAG: Hsp20 family protein [Deltaproteobacteria bacterium]|nr:Hsp20 family protein [Deltaproteobacteria bacterium]
MPRAQGMRPQLAAKPEAMEKDKPATRFESLLRPSAGDDPAVSTWVGAKAMIVTAEIPGAEPDNVDITVDGKRLILKKNDNGRGTSSDNGHHGKGAEFEKVLDLPYRVDRNSIDVSCEKGFVHIILKREDEQTRHNRTPLEAAIINTVSRYFNGNGARTTHDRKKEDQFLIQALQRYFQGSTATALKF